MTTLGSFVRGLLAVSAMSLAGASLVACVEDKDELAKGELDTSTPPGNPLEASGGGKADGGTIFAYRLESVHPYTNNLNKTYTAALSTVVPGCTQQVRFHFNSLRTEANYDFVNVLNPDGTVLESLTGNKDNSWTNWVSLGTTKSAELQLVTDYSVTANGFVIDQVDTLSGLRCPAPPVYACDGSQFDVTPRPGTCECQGPTRCVAQGDVVIEHTVGGGFTGQVLGHRLSGRDALNVKYLPGVDPELVTVGRVDQVKAQELISTLIASGLLSRPDEIVSTNWNETFSVTISGVTHTFSKAQGSFSTADAELIAMFEELFTCDGLGAPNACGDGFSCVNDACSPQVFCPALYQPVCGTNGTTYSNGCAAGAAGASVAHDGECGIAGDSCGTIRGLGCQDGFKCRYNTSAFTPPYPDAGGACVAATYCDAPADCAGLAHIAVPGSWACNANSCAWAAGPQWTAVAGSQFVTSHPYANNLATWKQINLSASGKIRLVKTGTFELENGYDFLEVWVWRNGAWTKIKSYTGTVGPAQTEELTGQYFYLKLVTDSSVTKYGFDVSVQSSAL